MPELSINHGAASAPSPSAARDEIFVPFVAHVRLVPNLATGKRTELIRNLEKTATRVEQDLLAAGFNIATPIAFTVQYGDFSARLTIIGFNQKSYNNDARLNINPTTDISVIHSGTDTGEKTSVVNINQGGSLASGQNTVDTVDQEVRELRIDLAAATTLFNEIDIVHIEYNGVKYGTKKVGGRSFPQ